MDLTKKQIVWGTILFGTLIGFNETVVGSFNLPYKSVILSVQNPGQAEHLIPEYIEHVIPDATPHLIQGHKRHNSKTKG